ncbi:MAG: MMPL family transporter, partial [Salinisphaeraceae bacterium]|nr:MMPL family transporter [Salinisphaeraceae bacterium]
MQAFDNALVAYGRWLIRWRWLVLVGMLGITVAIGTGMQLINFSTSYRIFFGPDNPQLQAFDATEKIYTKADNVFFGIESKSGDPFNAQVMTAVEELTEAGWQLPYANRVDYITNFQHTEAQGDDLNVAPLIEDAASLPPAAFERAKQIALNDPLLKNQLIASDAQMVGVSVTFQLPGKSITETPEVVKAARDLRDEILAKYPDLNIYMTGAIMLNNAFSEASQADIQSLIPLTILLMAATMWLLLRSIGATFATLIIIAVSAIAALGTTGYIGILLSPPSSTAPIIIMTLAIADSIHILVSMFFVMREGKSRQEALVESLRLNFMPVFLTSITTVIGFLSLNFSDAPPLQHLGNITAIGIAAAFIYSVTLLPALIAIIPMHAPVAKSRLAGTMVKIADFVIARQKAVLWGSLAVSAAILAAIPLNEANDRFTEFFTEDIQFRTDNDYIVENLAGLYSISFNLDTGEEGAVSDPAYLNKLVEFEEYWRGFDQVVHVSSFANIMKRLNKNMHGDDPEWYTIPQNRELAAQYLLLYELSLPYGLDLTNQVNIDKSGTLFRVTFENISSKETRHYAQLGEQWLQENAPHMANYAVGVPVMFSYISERNINSMFRGMPVAIIGISLILIITLRSLKVGSISLIPNLLPIGIAFGIWGMIDGEINFTMAMVMGMTLGIVVDDTIHFLSKYLRGRREKGYNVEEAVRYSLRTVGSAITVTTFILTAGFLLLATSNFLPNSGNSQLTALAITAALVADFLLLPALLLHLDRKQYAQSES